MVPAAVLTLDSPGREDEPVEPKGGGMAHPNVDMLNKGYDAFDKGDLDTVQALFSDDVVFHVVGNSPLAGDYAGRDEVLGFFGKLVEMTGGTFRLVRHAVLADDEHGVVLHNITAQREGKSIDVNAADIFHVRDGKVTEAWLTSIDQDAVDEFFS
jgi:ketosteroid isomerase-like protein